MNEFNPSEIQRFEFDSYEFQSGSGDVQLHYVLVGPQDPIRFTEHVTIPVESDASEAAKTVANRLARLLFLASGVSYYKIAAPSEVVVNIPITDAEKRFLKDVIGRGMTEFAFVNNIPQALTPEITAQRIEAVEPIELPDVSKQPLVPVGGGKDSIVTIEALRSTGFEPTLFSVNSYAPITATVERAKLPYLSVSRHIDPLVIELNRQGALNGHVPITMINSLLALMTAVMNGLATVVMSNERSASIGNVMWNGVDVNHQWAKSLEAERLLQEVIKDVVSPSVQYFSLLRPLSELRIARQFAGLTKYHDVFTSCNRAFHLDPTKRRIWCANCDKCRFVFLILSPYLSRDELVKIFKKDMFDDGEQLAGFRELLGIEGHKPLECVGEIAESRLALIMAAKREDWKKSSLVPVLLGDLPEDSLPTKEQERDIFSTAEHLIPAEYQKVLESIQ